VDFSFEEKGVGYRPSEGKNIYGSYGGKWEWKEYLYDMFFGMRRAFSRLGTRLQRRVGLITFKEIYRGRLQGAYLPANEDGTHKLDKHFISISGPRQVYVHCHAQCGWKFVLYFGSYHFEASFL